MAASPEAVGRAYWMLAGAALFWSGNFVVARAFVADIAPVTLAYWRWQLALLVFLPFAWRALYRERRILLRHFGWLLVMGLLGVAGFNTLVYQGLQYTTATNALLINSFIPILIIVIGVLLPDPGGRGWRQLAGVLISSTGMLLLIMRGQWQNLLALRFNQGDLWLLLAALLWALYSIGLRWRPGGLSARAFLLATMLIGITLLGPLYWFNLAGEPAFSPRPSSVLAIAYVALFASLGAFLLWNQGIAMVGAARGGQFIHLMPLFGALLAITLLGERLAWYHFGGGLLIGLGIYLTLRQQQARKGPAVTR